MRLPGGAPTDENPSWWRCGRRGRERDVSGKRSAAARHRIVQRVSEPVSGHGPHFEETIRLTSPFKLGPVGAVDLPFDAEGVGQLGNMVSLTPATIVFGVQVLVWDSPGWSSLGLGLEPASIPRNEPDSQSQRETGRSSGGLKVDRSSKSYRYAWTPGGEFEGLRLSSGRSR
jgi:hypothetical protein